MRRVKFDRNYAAYNRGEIAGFPDKKADELVERGVASFIDPAPKAKEKPKAEEPKSTEPPKEPATDAAEKPAEADAAKAAKPAAEPAGKTAGGKAASK